MNTPLWNFDDLVRGVRGRPVGPPPPAVTGISIDSRTLVPGEAFFGGDRAMPSSLYLTLGAGSTDFAGDDHFTVAVGAGYRLLVTDWLATHLGVRDHMFDSDLLGENKLTHNLQFTLGMTAFF